MWDGPTLDEIEKREREAPKVIYFQRSPSGEGDWMRKFTQGVPWLYDEHDYPSMKKVKEYVESHYDMGDVVQVYIHKEFERF